MDQYEIDMAIESVLMDMDFYDDYDFANENFDRIAVNSVITVGSILEPVSTITANLLNIPIAALSAENMRSLTKEAILERDPEQIKSVIKIITYRMRATDEATAFARHYGAGRIFAAGAIHTADKTAQVGQECLDKLNAALRKCR